ncbi:MAG: hypothetical protein WC849_03715 [Candidatus Paceibacterota bacterium]
MLELLVIRMDKNYTTLKQEIDKDFPIKIKGQKEFLENHWKDFNDKKAKMEKIVGDEFKEVIKRVKLYGGEIINYNIKYKPEFESLGIKITNLNIFYGNYPLEQICGGLFNNKLAPEIREFMEEYHINYIDGPNDNCNHK